MKWLGKQYYHTDPKYLDRQVRANTVDQDQTPPEGPIWSGSAELVLTKIKFFEVGIKSRSTLSAIWYALFWHITVCLKHTIQILRLLQYFFMCPGRLDFYDILTLFFRFQSTITQNFDRERNSRELPADLIWLWHKSMSRFICKCVFGAFICTDQLKKNVQCFVFLLWPSAAKFRFAEVFTFCACLLVKTSSL